MLYSNSMKPVALPPGRAKLSTKPAPTGSTTPTNTIGTVRVACSNETKDGELIARMTSGASATNSAEYLRALSASPAGQADIWAARIRALILIKSCPPNSGIHKLIFGRQHVHTIERWSMYRHILIPTDGSELAEQAVTNGLSLAKSVGAKVTVIIVEEPITGSVLRHLQNTAHLRNSANTPSRSRITLRAC